MNIIFFRMASIKDIFISTILIILEIACSSYPTGLSFNSNSSLSAGNAPVLHVNVSDIFEVPSLKESVKYVLDNCNCTDPRTKAVIHQANVSKLLFTVSNIIIITYNLILF